MPLCSISRTRQTEEVHCDNHLLKDMYSHACWNSDLEKEADNDIERPIQKGDRPGMQEKSVGSPFVVDNILKKIPHRDDGPTDGMLESTTEKELANVNASEVR